MKKIGLDEIFLLSEIAEKMNITFPESKGKDAETYGRELLVEFFKKLHKAKNEVTQLIETLTNRKVKDMNLKEIKESITAILKQEGILDFFK